MPSGGGGSGTTNPNNYVPPKITPEQAKKGFIRNIPVYVPPKITPKQATKGFIRNIPPVLNATIKKSGAGLSKEFLNDQISAEVTRKIRAALKVAADAKNNAPAGLSPEFIAEKKREQIAREANKALTSVASAPKSGGTTKKKSSSSGGGSSTPAPAPAPTGPNVTDLLNNLYDSLLKEIDTQGTSTAADYDATKATITNQYSQAQKDLYSKYQATMNPLAAQAANLGVDYQNSSINELADSSMKRLQETGDLSLASDQSYLDKMKLMQQGAFGALKTGSLQEKADAQLAYQQYLANLAAQAAAAKSGGGGGGSKKKGGGGGGSGGSSGVKGTASQSGTSIDTGIQSLLADLAAKGDWATYNDVSRRYDIAQGGGLESATIDATSFVPKYVPKVNKSNVWTKATSSVKTGAAKQTNAQGKALAELAQRTRDALKSINKGYGAPIYTNTVKKTSKG